MFVNLLHDYYQRNDCCEIVTWLWLFDVCELLHDYYYERLQCLRNCYMTPIIRGMFVNLLHDDDYYIQRNGCEFVTWLLSEECLWICYMTIIRGIFVSCCMVVMKGCINVCEFVTWWLLSEECLWICYMTIIRRMFVNLLHDDYYERLQKMFVNLLHDYYQRNVC
jgi:hypothetical protein